MIISRSIQLQFVFDVLFDRTFGIEIKQQKQNDSFINIHETINFLLFTLTLRYTFLAKAYSTVWL